MRSLFVASGLFALGVALTGTAAAAAPSPSNPAGPPDRILGVIAAHDQAKPARPQRTNNLSYHGGPVMLSNNVYTIFWSGSSGTWDTGYQSTINTYFSNVAKDNGKSSNVYFSDTQYSSIAYDSTNVATYDDSSAYPSNGCTDKATSICLSDAQLQAEIQRVMGIKGWTGGPQNLFFIFTPKGVGSCAGPSCAYSTYCAYHSWMGSGTSEILYANMPYAVQNYRIYTCDSGQRPNGVTADATINLISHEHNEAITDPQGSAWFDSQGAENGDKCAWNFGSASGPAGAQYNQTIGGSHYYLQQEWSNKSSGCVLTGQ